MAPRRGRETQHSVHIPSLRARAEVQYEEDEDSAEEEKDGEEPLSPAASSESSATSSWSSSSLPSPKRRLRQTTQQQAQKPKPKPVKVVLNAKKKARRLSSSSDETALAPLPVGQDTLRRLSHHTGRLQPDKKSRYHSCDPCSKRREKCDHYTVCGSCIIHDTVCTWNKAIPLYERDLSSLPLISPSPSKLRKEAASLRKQVYLLAPQVGLDPDALLRPASLTSILQYGLPTPPCSPT
ncbi:hypothetical protein JCM10213v2_006291 [Rhodosporidiobolus nylandii]